MSRWVGLSVAAGLLSALLFLSVMAGVSAGFLLSYVAPLPVLMAGLSLGPYGAAVASLVGILAVWAGTGGFTALAYGLAVALPALVVSRQALLWRQAPDQPVEWYPPGMVLAWLTLSGLVLMLGLGFVLPVSDEGIEASVRVMVERGVSALASSWGENERAALTESWVALFPALIGASWLAMATVNAVLAQGLLVKFKQARRTSPAYSALELPDWLLGVLVAAGLAGVAAGGDLGYVGRNIAALLSIPFGMQGLSLVHGAIRRRPNQRFLFVAFYTVFILAFGWMVIVAIAIGLGRQLMRLRRHMAVGSGKED